MRLGKFASGVAVASISWMAFASAVAASEAGGPERFDAPIVRLSQAHGVPERLVRRVIMRESRYAPHLTNHGHFGLMQIKLQTAHGMGYRGGATGLLDGETNLTYAVPYLANAYLAADKNEDRAVALYAGGYYYVAKHRGLTAKLRTANSEPLDAPQAVAYAAGPAEMQLQAANPFSFMFGQTAATPPPDASEATEAAELGLEHAPLPPRRPTNL